MNMSETTNVSKPISISINMNLPSHASELRQAEEKIKRIKEEIVLIKINRSINDSKHTRLYEETVSVLDWVGRMSVSVFEIRDELEMCYENAYPKAPRLAYRLFDEHYSRLHHPYSLLKNRCYAILEDLDKTYINKFKKNPPNWEI